MAELKPCPFCGSNVVEIVFHTEGGAQARCDACGGRTEWQICSDEAALTWNKRAEPAEALLRNLTGVGAGLAEFGQTKACVYCDTEGPVNERLEHDAKCPILRARKYLADACQNRL
jgi:Lar family restriction alleviation protein